MISTRYELNKCDLCIWLQTQLDRTLKADGEKWYVPIMKEMVAHLEKHHPQNPEKLGPAA